MDFTDLLTFLKSFPKRAVILSHKKADADAVCSSIVLKRIILDISPGTEITVGTVESISRPAKEIISVFEEEVITDPDIGDTDCLIITDTATFQQMPHIEEEVRREDVKVVVIDHHCGHKDTENIADFYIVDESATSTCEIVYQIAAALGITLDRRDSEIMLLGILSDTAHLRFATKETIFIVNELLKNGADYDMVLSILEIPEDISKRIARLKAAKRMEIHRVNDFIIVTSTVGTFASSAADSLIKIGADLAFVSSVCENEILISGRSTRGFFKMTGIELGRDIMPEIGEFIGGGGGGHSCAAAAKGGENIGMALAKCVELTKSLIEKGVLFV